MRGYVTAYDSETGEEVWRFFTVPGDPSLPFEHPEMEMAAETWKGGNWWEIGGGGTVWNSIVYDPDFDNVYLGVGNGAPWTRVIRSPGGGDNLFLSSIVALDVDTGRMKWHYQTTPGDNWDYTAVQDMALADMEVDGEMKKVLLQAPKNGFFYVIDRSNGKLLRQIPSPRSPGPATWTWKPVVRWKIPTSIIRKTKSGFCPGHWARITGRPCPSTWKRASYISLPRTILSSMACPKSGNRRVSTNAIPVAGISASNSVVLPSCSSTTSTISRLPRVI